MDLSFKYTILSLGIFLIVSCSPPSSIDSEPELDKPEQTGERIKELMANKPLSTPNRQSKNTIQLSKNQDAQTYWWQDATIYQIWVRSYFDTNGDGNGDLKGIVKKLDYIKSLNVDTILLSPIFEAPSYHGYDVTDHYSIEPSLGTLEDFELLIAKAKKMNLRVILDLPLNHTSDQHPWFLNSMKQDKNRYSEFYLWEESLPEGYSYPWGGEVNSKAVWHSKENVKGFYYGAFGYANPDLNFKNPVVVEEIKKIITFWIDKGVSGFRFDAARHFVEEGPSLQSDTQDNFAFISDLTNFIKRENKDVFILGESFADLKTNRAYFGNGEFNPLTGFDALFNFEFYGELKDLFNKTGSAIYQSDNSGFRKIKNTIFDLYSRVSKAAPAGKSSFVFINNHDVKRFQPSINYGNRFHTLIATFHILSPFNLSIYYGDEIGLSQQDSWEHEYARGLMHWDESPYLGFTDKNMAWMDNASWFPWKEINGQNHIPWSNLKSFKSPLLGVESQNDNVHSLLNFYRNLLAIKSSDLVLQAPDFLTMHSAPDDIWISEYINENGNRFLMVNLNAENNRTFELPEYLVGSYNELLTGDDIELSNVLTLKPGQILILKNEGEY